MDLSIAALLAQDGITNGAIYALLALALVMVFAVTRVILVPAGEFLTIGTLTLAAFDQGRVPGTVHLVAGAAVLAGMLEAWPYMRQRAWLKAARGAGLWTGLPLALAALAAWMGPRHFPLLAEVAMALVLTGVLGPLSWKIVFEPIADAPVLVLLIVAVALHFVLTGLSLYFFGAEGSRTPAFSAASFDLGAMTVSVQSLLVVVTSALAIAALALFFGRTLFGKALHATAVNRLGARLCGISPDFAGALTFMLAALLCAFCGVLIGPITTVYYDSGFIVSLKGFVGAIIGGLVSYPLAAAGALFIGLVEAFASFWASAYKEVIVFTLIIPVLLWRSLATHHYEEDE
ncbi:MAG TPA: branched-chain amino acid ABC transporter permease [Casimicrobiaceae bacterium]|jgi:branched-chain amino acid transport system permease protein|nr:branched-chain amino acid ABC transporter permease [Casimicrobiaceae bacterium]